MALVLAFAPATAFASDIKVNDGSNPPAAAPTFTIGQTVTFGAMGGGNQYTSLWYGYKKFTVNTISVLTVKVTTEGGIHGSIDGDSSDGWYNELRVDLVNPDANGEIADFNKWDTPLYVLGDPANNEYKLTDTGTYKVLPGTYYIRADGGSGNCSAYGKVTVTATPVTGVSPYSVNMTTAPLISLDKNYKGVILYGGQKYSGEPDQYLKYVYYKFKAPVAGKYSVTFSRSDTKRDNYLDLSVLDANGSSIGKFNLWYNPKKTVKVNVPKAGTYYVEVFSSTAGGNATEFNLKIADPRVKATKLKLNKSKLTLKKGGKYTLKITKYTPAGVFPKTITWTSNKKKVATVGKTMGIVKGVKKGTATITAKSWNGKIAKCKVTVR